MTDLMPPAGWTESTTTAAQAGGLTPAQITRVLDDLKQVRVLNAVDPTATIATTARVWHYAVVLANVSVGERCSIGSFCEIGRGSHIADGTRIGSHSFLPPNSVIGPEVFIGPNVTFCDDRHPYVHRAGDDPYVAEPPIVEAGAVIGAGSVILPGVRIGEHAKIGAGSVVTKDVPAFSHWRGEPARQQVLSDRSAEAWAK